MKLRREGVVNERVADRNEVEAPNPVSRSFYGGISMAIGGITKGIIFDEKHDVCGIRIYDLKKA